MREKIIRKMKELVEERTRAVVTVTDITKNNGTVLIGMSVREEGKSIAPMIYLDGYLANIVAEQITVDEAVEEIVRVYKEHKDDPLVGNGFAPSKEYILDRVELKLVNKEMNLDLLGGVPHRDFLDLAVVYIVVVERSDSGCTSFLLRNGMLEAYGITQEEIEETASRTHTMQGSRNLVWHK